jgi:molecular chaperone GrpE
VVDENSEEQVDEGTNGAGEDGAAADDAGETRQTPPDPVLEAKAEAVKLKDQLLRTAADFDNFRKRSRREVNDAEIRGREELLKDLLPVFDNLERAMQHADSATDVQALADGIRMVSRQFLDALGKLGIERVVSLGLHFDPSVHEAIQQLESPDQPMGTVIAEVQAGYRQGERLLRPAMVVVSKGPPATADPAADGEEPG